MNITGYGDYTYKEGVNPIFYDIYYKNERILKGIYLEDNALFICWCLDKQSQYDRIEDYIL